MTPNFWKNSAIYKTVLPNSGVRIVHFSERAPLPCCLVRKGVYFDFTGVRFENREI